MTSIGEARHLVSVWLTPIKRYERHVSAAAMALGFGVDNVAFGRIDRPATHVIFCAYLILAAGSIAAIHVLQSAADRLKAEHDHRLTLAGLRLARWRKTRPGKRKNPVLVPEAAALARAPEPISAPSRVADREPNGPVERHEDKDNTVATAPAPAPAPDPERPSPDSAKPDPAKKDASYIRTALLAATQFALGGLLSGFLVFYLRSAAFASSWLFLVLLAALLVGNEFFKRYHERLVFSSLILFFAIYSYAIFLVPVVTRQIGKVPFLVAGVLAVAAFSAFLLLLSRLGFERFKRSRLALLSGAVGIVAAMNLFYFTSLLPPLPLALADVGVYHSVKRVGDKYVAVAEPEPWYATLNVAPGVVHLVSGDPISVYSAVFAPVSLTTRITHLWQHFDPAQRRWVTLSTVSFGISGGRAGGYRAYSIKTKPKPGNWRVDILTEDGRLVGRERFVVVDVPKEAATFVKTMQ